MNILVHDAQCHSMKDCRCIYLRNIREGICEELAYDEAIVSTGAYRYITKVIRSYGMVVEDEVS